jgi:hypothetical protein
VVLSLAVLLALTLAVKGQNGRQPPEGAPKIAPLKLKLSTLKSSLCLGSSIDLQLEIQNVGAEEIKIDKADLWASFSYYGGVDPGTTSGRGGGQSSGCDHCRGNYLTLLPGVAYWDKHEFKRNDDFFDHAGRYFISTSLPYKIGSTDRPSEGSNDVEFELFQCGRIQDSKEQ